MERLIVIVGPTASGKTAAGVALAQEMNGVVVSADSRQIYAGMNIGTAKPQAAWSEHAHGLDLPEAVEGIDHYLFNIRTPDNPLTLADWQAAAFSAIDTILHQQQTPLLVGGTMLYIDSVIKNYELPQVPPNEELRSELEGRSVEQLYADLLAQDPSVRDFIEPNNKRRIIRALEVITITGKPFSAQRQQRPPRYDGTIIGLFSDWETVEANIRRRAKEMLDQGLVEETKHLAARYGEDLPLLQTMNYKQALAMINGSLSREAALEAMIRANVRYARRQMSWWRGRDDIRWFYPSNLEEIKKAAVA